MRRSNVRIAKRITFNRLNYAASKKIVPKRPIVFNHAIARNVVEATIDLSFPILR
jgi:hypothetical protein